MPDHPSQHATSREWLLDSEDATAHFARALADLIKPADVLLLSGDLGAGKTTLIRELAASLAHDPRQVSSPTFVIAHEYASPGATTLIHIDAYRLTPDEDEALLAWDELIRPDVITAIEWPERIPEHWLPEDHFIIRLDHVAPTQRRLTLTPPRSTPGRFPVYPPS